MAIVHMIELQDTDSVVIRNLVNYPVVIITPIHKKRIELPAHGQTEIRVGDVRECSYDQGCRNIFRNYIQICNETLAQEFGIGADVVEYNWSDAEITAALTTADINVLLDALDYAPDGIKEAIVDKAVELEIPDINRRKAIYDILGIDVTQRIENAHKSETQVAAPKKVQRRVSAAKTTGTKQRRVATQSE